MFEDTLQSKGLEALDKNFTQNSFYIFEGGLAKASSKIREGLDGKFMEFGLCMYACVCV